MDKAEELRKEISESVGFRVQHELEFLSTNFYVFDVNYKQLKIYRSNFKQPETLLKLWDQNNRSGFLLTLNEITRLLLNFLTSAKSLISVTRNAVPAWYKGTSFVQEYETKKDILAKDEECKFIEDLRNYSQHYQLPFASGEMQFDVEKGLIGRFLLNKNMLQAWQGWAKGKMYLTEIKEDIDLEILVDSYYNKILDFHQWIFSRIQEINSEEIRNTLAVQSELRKLLKEIFES